MFDKNTILALIIIGIILLMTPIYYRMINPPAPESETPTQAPVTTPPAQEIAEETTPPPETAVATVPVQGATLLPALENLNREFVRVETPLFSMAIGSNGKVTDYLLNKYKTYRGNSIALITTDFHTGKPIGGFDLDFGQPVLESISKVQFEKVRDIKTVENQPDSVILKAGNDTTALTLTYVFYPDRYGFDLVVNTKGFIPTAQQTYQIKWQGGVPGTEPDTLREMTFCKAYAFIGDVLEKVSIGGKERKDFQATGQTHFAAARSKYFMAAVIPETAAQAVEIHARHLGVKSRPTSPILYDFALDRSWKGNAEDRYKVYWGPIDLRELRSAGAGLEKTMDWGWTIIKPFSMAILWSLKWLGGVIPNYGIVIIVFSIIVKVILWPLTRKSQISMKKMAAIQPEIKELREKHKANPQAMNKAIMGMYKERGVNPASGCVPLIFQMPLLYGLFITFRSTIEFRQEPFIFWITDLSRPDYVFDLPFTIPLYGAAVAILPLIMGATQFVMSKRTVTDPNQKMMAYIMPVFMTLIFNQFPSGLTLYYTLYNVWALLEQRLIKIPGS